MGLGASTLYYYASQIFPDSWELGVGEQAPSPSCFHVTGIGFLQHCGNEITNIHQCLIPDRSWERWTLLFGCSSSGIGWQLIVAGYPQFLLSFGRFWLNKFPCGCISFDSSPEIFKNIFIFNWKIIALQCCLVSATEQCESAISMHISPPS